jgi:DNA mismatch repair protein MutS2
MAVIDYLKEKKSKTIVSTHFSEVKAYGYNEEGVESASMEFNAETLSPTYRLLLGIPGESNALKIARRLGVSEEIINRAEKYISEEDKKVESMIATIKEKSKEVEETQAEVERLKEEAEKVKIAFEDKLRNIEKDKNQILKEAYENSDRVIKDAQEKAKALIEKIRKDEVKKEDLKATEKALQMLRNEVREDKDKNVLKEIKIKSSLKVVKGEKVYIKSLNSDAMILKVMEDKELAQVQAGVLKLTVSFDDIKKIEEKKVVNTGRSTVTNRSNAKSEIDLRGRMVDDAIHELENYLDKAMMSGYGEVYVIHGKGTGLLRKGIQEFLRTCPYIDSYRDANQNEGGIGCTVVKFK